MAITWGTAVGNTNWKFRVGVEFYTVPTPTHEQTAVTVTARLWIWTQYACNENSNDLGWSGTLGTGTQADSAFTTPSSTSWSTSNQVMIKSVSTSVTLATYGSTTPLTVTATFSGITEAGTSTQGTVTATAAIPARPYAAPALPTGLSVARVSDTQHTLSWTNTTPTSASAPYQYIDIQRMWNGTAWQTVAQLLVGPTVFPTAWSDATTIPDRSYQWRVRARNISASSAYTSATAVIYTTPAAPTNPVATKVGTDIEIDWGNPSTIDTAVEVWHAANGVWDGAALATIAANSVTYTHISPAANVTHAYKIRAVAGTNYSAYSPTSNTIQLPINPGTPTNLASAVFDATQPTTFTFEHVPVDTTAMTAYEIQYRLIGAGSWTSTGKVTSTTEARTWAADTFVNGSDYEWQVRTWGQYAVDPAYSPWSASQTFSTSSKPTATISSPLNGELAYPTNLLTAEWAYYDAESTPQSGWRATVYSATDEILQQVSGTTEALTYTFSRMLANFTTYKLGVTVRDSDGLWSDEDVVTFTTEFSVPPVMTMGVVFSDDTGAATITINNPPPGPGEEAVDHNELWRSVNDGPWTLVANDLPENAVVTDYIPAIKIPNKYKVIAYSALPSSTESAEVTLTVSPAACGEWLWFNAGPSFSVTAKFRGAPAVRGKRGRDKVLRQFTNRTGQVEYAGPVGTHTLDVGGIVEGTALCSESAFVAVNEQAGPTCYRDSWGRRLFVSMGDIEYEEMAYTFMKIGVALTELDYTEGE